MHNSVQLDSNRLLKALKKRIENRPHGHPLCGRVTLRYEPFVFGPIGAEVAWLVALKSLPCHQGSSYVARLTTT